MTQPSMELDGPPGARPLRVLAGGAALLAVGFCLLGFVGGVGVSDLAGVFVVGGGLLAGTAALPRSGRVLAPASVAVAVGVLMLLQAVMTSRVTGLLVAALVLAFVEMVAVVGALLVDVGLVARGQEPRSVPQAPGQAAEVAWSSSPAAVPAPAPGDPTMTYVAPAGSFGAAPSIAPPAPFPSAPFPGAPSSGAPSPAPAESPAGGAPSRSDVFPVGPSGAAPFPVGPSGGGPVYGLSTPPAAPPERSTEAVPRFGPGGNPSAAGTGTAVPVNGSAVPHAFDAQESTAVHPTLNGSSPVLEPPALGEPVDEPGQAGPVNGFGPNRGFSPSARTRGAAPIANGSVPLHGLSSPGAPGAPTGPGGSGPSSVPPAAGLRPPLNGRSPVGPRPADDHGPAGSDSGRGSVGEGPAPRRSATGAPSAAPASGLPVPGANDSDEAAPGNSTMPVHGPSGVSPQPPTTAAVPPSAGPSGARAVVGPSSESSPTAPTGAHRAPAPEPSSTPSAGRGPGRSGAHRAPAAEMPLFGLAESDRPAIGDAPPSGLPSPTRTDNDGGLPRRRPSPSAGSGGYHTAPRPGPADDRADRGGPAANPAPFGRSTAAAQADSERAHDSGYALFQPAPRGGASHPGLALSPGVPPERHPGSPDPTPDTTVLPVSDRAADPTPGQAPRTDRADESVATPSWLGPNHATPALEAPSGPLFRESGRHTTDRRTSPDPDPDVTRFFPAADR